MKKQTSEKEPELTKKEWVMGAIILLLLIIFFLLISFNFIVNL